jgi:hypothetical protein
VKYKRNPDKIFFRGVVFVDRKAVFQRQLKQDVEKRSYEQRLERIRTEHERVALLPSEEANAMTPPGPENVSSVVGDTMASYQAREEEHEMETYRFGQAIQELENDKEDLLGEVSVLKAEVQFLKAQKKKDR